ncbi:ABC transporter substrate-binding protein [Propionivibrio dicarboxylicus]|uniref:Extracellular solute-binding protein, family 3 n=1 Tax=Propionivibrio dicarboxylicus TaxID=83767 RepID=A0A1G8AK50_9RHOO|nr:ABC transporter substrate-binding protein [Propionivibrio dicarboxylicus]SDH21186.1 hypothetical protein SAMN05660652_01409 [Propionivibrio dicarboxylicus]
MNWLRLLLALFFCGGVSAEPLRLTYPPPEAAGDERHSYYWELLEAALTANRDRFGDFEMHPYPLPMTFQRGVAEVETGKGLVNIVSRATNRDLETRLLPIRIPLDKGLLGARMFLVMPETQAKLERVRTLKELQEFTIGQNPAWTDVKILQSAGFNVVLSEGYSTLFAKLAAGRFDLFSRGIIEIESEWRNNRDERPGLSIEKRFLLHYPMPRYFFVPRTAEGARMAERIEDGLLRLRRSGEFDRRFKKWKQLVLKDLQLSGRIVFRLANPELGPETPLADKSWWDDLAAELGHPR